MRNRTLLLALMFVFSSLSAAYAPERGTVLDDTTSPQLTGNTVNCGTNASNVSFEVETHEEEYSHYDTVSPWLDLYCGVWNTTYMLYWGVLALDNYSEVDSGNHQFVTNTSSVSYHPNHTDHFNEFDVSLYYMEPGNYSVYGNFYESVNGSWSYLANESWDFTVNTTTSTTACGYNDTLVSMDVPVAGYHYYEGASVYPYADIECPVLGTSYVFEWELHEQNSSTVVQTGWNNFTATWQNVHLFNDGSGFFHDINLAFHNLTEGVYTWSTMLTLSNGSYLDSANLTFEVWSNATNSTGCGYDSAYTSIYAYSWYGIFSEGDTFDSTVNSYCNLLNSTTMIEWTVAYASNSTIVAQQNQSWYVSSTSIAWNITRNPFEIGNYTFTAKLSVWDNTTQGWNYIVDNSYNFAYVANTTTPGGFMDIDTNGYNFTYGDTVSATYESYNLTQGEMYNLAWAVVDANSNIVDQGNWTWMAYNHFSVEWKNYTVDGAPLQSGAYCFFGELYHVDANYSLASLDNDDTCIMILGGNNTGGNGTGGNNTGNNTGGNGTGGNNTGNNTGQLTYSAYLNQNCFNASDVIEAYITISGLNATEFVLEWEITEGHGIQTGSSIVASGAPTINVGSTGSVSYTWAFNASALSGQNFTVMLNPADASLSNLFPSSPFYYPIVIGCNTNGGNTTADTDGDGVPDVLDAFPSDPTEWDDFDHDGVGDNGDNCPTVANPNQADGDNDGIGTACDSNEGGNTGNNTGGNNTGNGTGGNGTGGNTTNPPMNSPPVISSVTIMPVLPTDADTLTCSYSAYDADGDNVSVTVQWEVNGNVILVGSMNLTSGFAVGDDVECTVTGYDGQMSGNSDSDMVTILPSTIDGAIDAGNGLPALSTVGTLVAIAFGVGLSRRKDE